MATNVANKEDRSKKVKKFPKIPIYKLYKKNPFRFFPSYAIKDFEQIMTFGSGDKFRSIGLLSHEFLNGFCKTKHEFLHMGLVQVAIKPLARDGLDAPVTVLLRDDRHRNIKDSLLAVVEANLSQGPFYFNCFPSFSVSMTDVDSFNPLVLCIKTTGISVAVTVRIVCKAMVDLSAEYLKEPMLGKTDYFHAISGALSTTQWDEVIHDNGPTGSTDERSMVKSRSTAVVASGTG